MPIDASQLVDIAINDEKTSQTVFKVKLEEQDYYFKLPPQLENKQSAALRILNEAICGLVVRILSEKSNDQFLTPEYKLVTDHGQLHGVLVSKIHYEPIGDYPTDAKGLKKALRCGLGALTTIRYFLGDPDGYCNIGYHQDQLSSIDYGLANYDYLYEQKALNESEQNRVPEDEFGLFSINEKNILSGMLRPMGEVELLSHHVFSSFNRDMAQLCSSSREDRALARLFFTEMRSMLYLITKVVNVHNFSAIVFERLGIAHLTDQEQTIAQEIIERLIFKATLLKQTLKKLSKELPERMQEIINPCKIDPRTSPIMFRALSSMPHLREINTCIIDNQALERERKNSNGAISPANGGGVGGYSRILKPIPIRNVSR